MEKPLIVLPINEACQLKWVKGQQHYGKEFVGDPVEQLYEEAIDGINYAKEGRDNWTYDNSDLLDIEADLYVLAGKIRSLYAKGKHNKKATAKQFARPVE